MSKIRFEPVIITVDNCKYAELFLMKCPKCHTELTKNEQICPNCKKVLMIKCPNCGELSTKSVCAKCGTVLLNKCYKCGKLNLTANEKCSNCGLDINASIGLRESVIEKFAVLTIEITNLDEIKEVFNSDKIKEQFRQNLFTLIKKPALQKKLRVQMIENTFIIRFNKDYSFNESCVSAVDFSLFVTQTIAQINKKLSEAKGTAIKVQMAIQSRDVYAKKDEYKSGINVNVVYSSLGSSHIFDNVETIVDYYVYQELKNEYPMQSLCAVYLKNQMVMFFELMLHKLLQNEDDKKIIEKMKLPKSADFVPEEEDEEQLINFDGLNCTFVRSRAETVLSKLKYARELQNPIISIKHDKKYAALGLLSDTEIEDAIGNCKVFRFSCTKNTKYSVYGLLKQLLYSYKNKSEEEILLNPALAEELTEDYYLKSLLLLQAAEQVHPEDLKFGYYEAFSTFLRSIPYKAVFVIEDFHNIDETSLEIIKYLVDNDELGNVGFVVSNEKNWSLHRKIYRLMTMENYLEIEITPSANKTVLSNNLEKLKKIQDTFFLEKVLENTKGSYFYFDQALKYLVDEEVLEYLNAKYNVKEEKMLVLPVDLDELAQKRLLSLEKHTNHFELFASMLLISEKIPLKYIDLLGIEKTAKIVEYLEKKDFIKVNDEGYIVINNYNLMRENLETACEPEMLKVLAQNLLEKIYINITVPNSTKATLLELAKLKKEAFTQWHSLAMISSQIGDFCTYLNCTNKFLSLVDNVIDEDTDRSVEQIKIEVYTELASMLYKYYPDKTMSFLEMILANFEAQNDDDKIKEISNKLVQSCIISGNYNNALEYMGKIIARTKRSSFNPHDKDFSLKYFLTHLVMIEIYFNLGKLNECIDLGEELFKHIDFANLDEKILPEGFSKKQFEDTLFDALFFINISRILRLKPNCREKLAELKNISGEYKNCFRLMELILDYLEGKDITHEMTEIVQDGFCDKYSQILFPFLQGLVSMRFQEWEKFGNYIYDAKIKVAQHNLYQFNYYCDLLIGYAYQNLNNFKKAKQIYYSVLDLASEKGMKNLVYATWFLIAKIETAEQNFALAENILNNYILKTENDSNTSELISLLVKSFSSRVMLLSNPQKNAERALFCAEQAYSGILQHKLITYLPPVAELLSYIYAQIVQGEQTEEVIKLYQSKLLALQNTLQKLFPGAAEG